MVRGKNNYFYGKRFFGKENPRYGMREEKCPVWKGGSYRHYHRQAERAWEEFWREQVPKGYLLHHIDRDMKNNEITNLALITHRTHAINHEFYKHFGGKD